MKTSNLFWKNKFLFPNLSCRLIFMPSLPHLVFGELTLEHDDNVITIYICGLTITQSDSTGTPTLPCHGYALKHFNHRTSHKWKPMTWHRSVGLWNL